MELHENINADINDLIISFLSGNISVEDNQKLERLLKSNPEYRALFDEMKLSWDASGISLSDISPANTQKPWEKLKESIENSEDSFIDKNSLKIRLLKVFRTAAVWLLLIAGSSFVTWKFFGTASQKDSSSCIITTPLGSRTQIILPDGTEVWLNAGTSLKYPEKFSPDQRDIYLTGEAFFKVVTNKNWPFVVHTPDLDIRALGTSFNVKAYQSEKVVTTTLIEGIVKLENKQRDFHYTLQPKQELVFLREPEKQKDAIAQIENREDVKVVESNKDAVIKNEVNTIVSTSWKDKRWIVNGEPVENFAVLLERKYDMKINIVSEELKQFKFSGTIENETLEQVLDFLRYTIPVKYKFNKGSVDLIIDSTMKERNKAFLK